MKLQSAERLNNGMVANIADFEKLMNIRYKLLDGNGEGEKDLTVIFNNALSRHPSLFDAQRTTNVEISQERKEAEIVEGVFGE